MPFILQLEVTRCRTYEEGMLDEDKQGTLMLLQKSLHVMHGHQGRIKENSTSLNKAGLNFRNEKSSSLLHHNATPSRSSFTTYYQVAPKEFTDSSAQVLLFWPIGSSDRIMKLVKANIDHVHKQLTKADVFFVHYDLQKGKWLANDRSWYKQHVTFSVERKGYKFQLLRALIFEELKTTPDLYSWIWCLDEDIKLVNVDLPRMFAIADTTGALITIPAFTQAEDDSHRDTKLDYPIQEPRGRCQYRYTPFVEVMFPLIRPIVLKLLLFECEHCVHEKSFWGLDCVWCKWSANRLGSSTDTACAIIDETPALHMNFKTMPSKYGTTPGHAVESRTFLDMALGDRQDVRDHHEQDWVDKDEEMWSHCVRR